MNANTQSVRSQPITSAKAVINANVASWRKQKFGREFKRDFGSMSLVKGGAALDSLLPNLK